MLEAHEDVLIVVHSSWREEISIKELQVNVGARSARLAKRIVDVTKKGDKYDSILGFVSANRDEIESYIIIDDDEHCFPPDCQELILCDEDLGVADETVQARIRAFLDA